MRAIALVRTHGGEVSCGTTSATSYHRFSRRSAPRVDGLHPAFSGHYTTSDIFSGKSPALPAVDHTDMFKAAEQGVTRID